MKKIEYEISDDNQYYPIKMDAYGCRCCKHALILCVKDRKPKNLKDSEYWLCPLERKSIKEQTNSLNDADQQEKQMEKTSEVEEMLTF